jgi:hypothetical protein
LEGTAAGKLDGHEPVILQLQQIESWRRRPAHIGLVADDIKPAGQPVLQFSGDFVEDFVRLADDHVISQSKQFVGFAAGIRPANNRAPAKFTRAGQEIFHILLLDMHPANHDEVGP